MNTVRFWFMTTLQARAGAYAGVAVLLALAAALLILANLVAAVPARAAGRTPVATILRSE